ncbi:AAA family ATPase [Microbacterium sp. OVT16B]|uniref:AAA family ATPase n=1 Tax=Microbacterium sp. OVT16B TaxID=2862682 RepID=UPI001CC01D24|nr:SMC family ATPase [Microbacterium sp. OVT16B]
MQLHRLEVEGFGPFRSRQIVDFDAFADDGIFLIAGRTGAGKSSILDAVCFGLYGGVPRYDGSEKRLRSDHSEPDEVSEVVVEFSTPSGRFRVTRSPEYLRPAKRGGGLTKQAAAVALDEWTDVGWIGRAARAVDVAGELDEILQLSREQFLQVILLAQNRFSEFLLANSRDRQSLLRRLFGTERFEDVQSRFDERRREAELRLGTRLAAVTARLDEADRLVASAELGADGAEGSSRAEREDVSVAGLTSTAPTDERLDDLRRAKARADYRVERRAAERDDAETRLTAADAALAALREDQRAQCERDRARAALDRLDAELPQIADARAELDAARAAEALRATIAAATRAQVALTVSTDAEQEARRRWTRFGIDLPAESTEELDAWASEQTKETGAWEHARALERRAPQLAVDLQAAEDRVAAASARIDAGEMERSTIPERIAAATRRRDDARRRADRAADLLAAREAAAARKAAAAERERVEAQEVIDNAAVDDAAAAFASAQARFAQLRKRRSDGMAGELASALVDGEACPVCGAYEHPAPAEHVDPVSADDVAEAEAARDAAAQRERMASEKLAATRAALAAATARADGRTVEQATADLTAAEEEYDTSVASASAVAELEQELAALTARAEALENGRADDTAALSAAREELAVLLQRRADAEAQILSARGEHETVAARLEEAEERIASARALSEAIAERERHSNTTADAVAERDAALAASAFDDVAAAEAALRSPAAQAALTARIDEHTAQRGKEKAILLDLELRTLPEEPIDLLPQEQASVEARARWTAAVDAASRAEGTAERLGGLIESAASEQARVGDDAAEFEVLRELADTIAGRGANSRKMTLETFVLAAELEEIVRAANRRLSDMSAGRYQLQHSDALAARGAASGLGIVVFDAFTGQSRPAQSLSGGETFLSSLALALGLAEVVTARAGGIRLDTLFIDEGFGSLDGDTLEVAMRTLDELRQGGRTVGVISHVEAMQEQIPAQLTVRATAEGPSVIEAR